MGDIVEDNGFGVRRIIIVPDDEIPLFEFILSTAWYDYLISKLNNPELKRGKDIGRAYSPNIIYYKTVIITPNIRHQVSQDKTVRTYPGFDVRAFSDEMKKEMEVIFQKLKIELTKLLQLLKKVPPPRLESLRRLSLANILWLTYHFKDLSRLSSLYSWKELSVKDAEEIDRLINSENDAERDEGRRRVLEIKAKEALQIVYQNQYGSYIPRDVDMYAGPRAVSQCSII